MSNKTKLVMSVPKHATQQSYQGKCTLKVDPVVHDMVSEIAFITRKSMLTVANEMLQFAYENVEWEE